MDIWDYGKNSLEGYLSSRNALEQEGVSIITTDNFSWMGSGNLWKNKELYPYAICVGIAIDDTVRQITDWKAE